VALAGSRPDAARTIGGLPIGRLADDERGLFAGLVFMCKLLFFLYLGISLRFNQIDPYLIAVLIVGAVYACRTLFAKWLLPRDCS